MTAILEAVGAGTAVALINRFIISNNWIWGLFLVFVCLLALSGILFVLIDWVITVG